MGVKSEESPCRRGCCWTPYGHSVLRDGPLVQASMRCRCHGAEPVTLDDLLRGAVHE